MVFGLERRAGIDCEARRRGPPTYPESPPNRRRRPSGTSNGSGIRSYSNLRIIQRDVAPGPCIWVPAHRSSEAHQAGRASRSRPFAGCVKANPHDSRIRHDRRVPALLDRLPFAGCDHPDRRSGRPAPTGPRRGHEGEPAARLGLRRPRGPLRHRRLADRRGGRRRQVLHRLHRRTEPVLRQRVRDVGDLRLFRNSPRTSAPGAVLGHSRRDGLPRHPDRNRRRGAPQVRVGAAVLLRPADLHRHQAPPA